MTVSIATVDDERKFNAYLRLRNAPRDTIVHGVHPNSHKALDEYAALILALSGGNETIEDLSTVAAYHANTVASVTPFVAAMQVCMKTINDTMHIVNLLAVATGQDVPFAIQPEEVTVEQYLTTLATAIATLQVTQAAMRQAAQALSRGGE